MKFNIFPKWTILDAYILRKFIGTFFYSLALILVIVVVFDISENMQRFLDNQIPLKIIITKYYFNFIPYFASLFISLFTFIAVIFFTSKLSAQNEIIALLNGGMNFKRFLVPYIYGGVLIAILSFFMANFVIPSTNRKMVEFNQKYFKRSLKLFVSDIHIKTSQNTYVYVQQFNGELNTGYDFSYEHIENQRLLYKITAQEALWDTTVQRWILKDVKIRQFVNGQEFFEQKAQIDTVFSITPKDLTTHISALESLNFTQLLQFIRQEKSRGSDQLRSYEVEKHKRIATPFSTIILTLLGVSLAARKTRRGTGVHIFLGLGLAFSLIFFQQVSKVFGISGALPPVLAVWIPNLVYFGICLVLLKITPK